MSSDPPINDFEFACPYCGIQLERRTDTELYCAVDEESFYCIDGVWRLLPPQRQEEYRQFCHEYETIRQAEGRGASNAAYYRALPFADLTGRFALDWQIRARSFQALIDHVVQPLTEQRKMPLKILDLGAGNGWLSARLAHLGHQAAAIDLLTNPYDGLGAHIHYDTDFAPIQAEFDRLPLTMHQCDLAIFNASLHYSTHYESTLGEALRVLKPQGYCIILDSPIYKNADSGKQMVREREAAFQQAYGFASNALDSENFLTFQRIEELGHKLALQWRWLKPRYGLRWVLRPWRARVRGHRQPAHFVIVVGRQLYSD